MKTGIIYIATNIKNKKSYIGQTTMRLDQRIKYHKRDSKRRDYLFYRAANKHGWSSFSWNILYKNIPDNQLNNMEKWCIANYNTYNGGYNSTLGGDSNPMINPETRKKVSKTLTGRSLSKEHKQKLSEILIGNSRALGYKHTKEAKHKMSVIKTGKKFPESTKQKIRDNQIGEKNSFYGKKHSQDTLQKISKALTKYVYKITNPDGKVDIVYNIRVYCKIKNLDPSAMYKVAKGKYNHHKGYKVENITSNVSS